MLGLEELKSIKVNKIVDKVIQDLKNLDLISENAF
jgi:BRCT domain type II-containing protein